MKKLLSLLSIFAIVLSCSSDETSTPVTPPPASIAKYTITVTATAGKTDIVTLIYDGATFYAAISQNF